MHRIMEENTMANNTDSTCSSKAPWPKDILDAMAEEYSRYCDDMIDSLLRQYGRGKETEE